MTAERPHDVRRQSIRVALAATAIVARSSTWSSPLAVVALVDPEPDRSRSTTGSADGLASHVNGADPGQGGGGYEPAAAEPTGPVYGPRLLVLDDRRGRHRSIDASDPSNPALPAEPTST